MMLKVFQYFVFLHYTKTERAFTSLRAIRRVTTFASHFCLEFLLIFFNQRRHSVADVLLQVLHLFLLHELYEWLQVSRIKKCQKIIAKSTHFAFPQLHLLIFKTQSVRTLFFQLSNFLKSCVLIFSLGRIPFPSELFPNENDKTGCLWVFVISAIHEHITHLFNFNASIRKIIFFSISGFMFLFFPFMFLLFREFLAPIGVGYPRGIFEQLPLALLDNCGHADLFEIFKILHAVAVVSVSARALTKIVLITNFDVFNVDRVFKI